MASPGTYENTTRHVDPVSVRAREPVARNRLLQLVPAVAVAIVAAAVGSHVVVNSLKIETSAGKPFSDAARMGSSSAYLAGSSLAGQGLDWERISKELDQRIFGWGIAGGSPFEWEVFQPRATEAERTFIVVSSYDLDEAILCDFRADVVPLDHTIKALLESHATWPYAKRTLSQYPLTWLRLLFPTLGRSRGIMGKLRVELTKIVKPSATGQSEAGPTLSFGREAMTEESRSGRISDWSEAEILRKLTAMRVGFQGDHSFRGLKHFALERMLKYGKRSGKVIVVVLPVSPLYLNECMAPDLTQQFESSLVEIQHDVPEAEWVRLDQIAALNTNDNFYDLVHMNLIGQQATTDIFLKRMAHLDSPQ